MIFELIIAAYLVEGVRGTYYHLKEAKRHRISQRRFFQLLDGGNGSWEYWDERVKEDMQNNPKLYEKIPQTWMYRLYWKLKKE